MERFVIISSGLQPLTNHKVLHLVCCSSPRSASGLNVVWRKAIFWILLFRKFEPFFFSPVLLMHSMLHVEQMNKYTKWLLQQVKIFFQVKCIRCCFESMKTPSLKKITTSSSGFSAILSVVVFFYLSIFNRIKSFCGLYGYL